MSEQNQPSVIRFEQEVAAKNYEAATNELLAILKKLDSNFGEIHDIVVDVPEQLNHPNLHFEKVRYLCTRLANAITQLFTDPALAITRDGAYNFLTYQRWLALIFASSPYLNADHILQSYNQNPEKDLKNIHIATTESAFIKFAIFYLPESNAGLDLEAFWKVDPYLCASLCFALQAPRFIGTDRSFEKRNRILQWFPEKLATLDDISKLPANISHDVYMHCSYDIAANKHDVKKGVNQLIRKFILANGWQDRDVSEIGQKNGKPVMMVMLEHFHSAHSIYRTHSTSMIAAREHFYLVGIGSKNVDVLGRQVFDEFHETDTSSVLEKLDFVRAKCEEFKPAIFYMPSIGMDLTTVYISNTRLAPIQAVALGHPATTHSEFIEYVVVEDDYVGSEACFSEKLLRLPKDALPYVPSALAPASVEYRLREKPEVVNIGVASTTMKLNPYFLSALRAIKERAKVKVHFHFAMGQSTGVTHLYVERFLKTYLGNAVTAHSHLPYDQYLRVLHNCDMMVNPFPFGNTNGIIDMVTLGLVGVCKTGPEVHEHIDEGLFKRLGLPEWLIAESVEDYVERAVRLAENHEERLALRRQIIENNGLKTLFTGNPKPMGEKFIALVNELQAGKNGEKSAKTEKAEKKSPEVKAEKAEKAPAKKAAEKKSTEKKPAAKKESPLKAAAKKLKKA